jgi:hypothetical protein
MCVEGRREGKFGVKSRFTTRGKSRFDAGAPISDCLSSYKSVIVVIINIINIMKLSIVVAVLSALALFAPAQATKVRGVDEKTRRSRALKGMKGMGSKGAPGYDKPYFAVLSAAQEIPLCMSESLGNALITLKGYELCVRLAYEELSGPELFSHIHGPAPIGENAQVIFTLSLESVKVDCFTLNAEQIYWLNTGKLYFNVHSEMCPAGEIRGQIIQ